MRFLQLLLSLFLACAIFYFPHGKATFRWRTQFLAFGADHAISAPPLYRSTGHNMPQNRHNTAQCRWCTAVVGEGEILLSTNVVGIRATVVCRGAPGFPGVFRHLKGYRQ